MSNDPAAIGRREAGGTLGAPPPHLASQTGRAGRPDVVRRRAERLQQEERRLLREWERSRRRFFVADRRLQHHTDVWEARILKAMRWTDPTAWWRTNRRVDAGERWIGDDAEARWRQRVVYVTRDRVLELAVRRDAALAPLRAAKDDAGRVLQATTRRFVATAGRDRALFVLGIPPAALHDLLSGKPSPRTVLGVVLGPGDGRQSPRP